MSEREEQRGRELERLRRALEKAEEDITNLLSSSPAPAILLDREGRIRHYTPQAIDLFTSHDLYPGGSVFEAGTILAYPALRADHLTVQRTGLPCYREVRSRKRDRVFLVTLRPFMTARNEVEGSAITFKEVTEERRYTRNLHSASAAAAQRQAELSALFDAAPFGLCLLDTELRYARLNQALAAMIGRPIADCIGRTVSEVVPEVFEGIRAELERVRRTRQAVRGIEVEGTTKADPGVLRYWIADYFPVFDDHEELIAIGCLVVEVSEERRLQQRIATQELLMLEREARLGRVLEHLPLHVALVEGEEHRVVFGNRVLREFVHTESLRQAPLASLLEMPEPSELRSRLDHARTSGAVWQGEEVTLRNAKADAPEGLIANMLILPLHGEVDGAQMLVGFYDVTDLVSARRSLAATGRRLRSLIDGFAGYAALTGRDGTVVEVSANSLSAGGLDRGDVIGRAFWDCGWWSGSAQHAEHVRELMAAAARGEQVREDIQARYADGTLRHVDFQVTPVFDDAGMVAELIPSGVDIQERLNAERRKDDLLAELEHRVKDVIATLQAVLFFTGDFAEQPSAIPEALDRRLAAMARAHELVTSAGWTALPVDKVVEYECRAVLGVDASRIRIQGRRAELEPAATIFLSLGIHELVDNALRYGALSVPQGLVEIRIASRAGRFAGLAWEERHGPRLEPAPRRRGFGSFMLEELLAPALGAHADISRARKGLRFSLRYPKEALDPDSP